MNNITPRTPYNANIAPREFRNQWTHPGDAFSVLLLLGGDVIARALAQLAGGSSGITPVTSSFEFYSDKKTLTRRITIGWVAYAVSALVSVVGENKLMPPPDIPVKVINAKSGYLRDNSSWVLARVVRDFDLWMDPKIRSETEKLLREKEKFLKEKEKEKPREERRKVDEVTQAGLTVSVYEPSADKSKIPGDPKTDWIYRSGFAVAILQLGVAAIPCGVFGDWGILMNTAAGTVLAFLCGSLPQWRKEKWACRRQEKEKAVVLTRGNGSQHAILILGRVAALDLEDLATAQNTVDEQTGFMTRLYMIILTVAWILLLITAAGEVQNTWFLLAVGGIGILHNVAVAGWRRRPAAFGLHLTYVGVIANTKVMQTLYEVEERYPHAGLSLQPTFFPGDLRENEKEKWADFKATAKQREKEREMERDKERGRLKGVVHGTGKEASAVPSSTMDPASVV